MFDFENANREQRLAITTTEGPVLAIAGPGTGKTFTLVKRIAYLVLEKNVSPCEIMVVTFTEKAARELITRISNEFVKYDFNININEMYIGTFHSVCMRFLKENLEEDYGNKAARVIDAFEQTYLVCRNIQIFNVLRDFNKHISVKSGVWKQAVEICRYVNQIMEEMADIDAMENDKDEDIRFLAHLVKRYRQLLKKNNVMDFSSIQTETYRMFYEHSEILNKIQKNISYIMVDEYQDTNYIQEMLIFMFAGEKNNICVVGDDDQGIYRFRGATIRNILEFPEKFAKGECNVICLNENYRSESKIIDFYNGWMHGTADTSIFNWNKYRYNKYIYASEKKADTVQSVYKCDSGSLTMEKQELLQLVLKLKQNNNIKDYNQVAFLFQSVKSEEAIAVGRYFEENGVPVYSPRSDMFFMRQEVKQIIGCLIMCFASYMDDLKKNMFNYSISAELRQYYISCIKAAGELVRHDVGLHEYISGEMDNIRLLKEDSGYGLLDIFYKLISFEPFNGYLQENIKGNVLKTRAARNLSEVSRMLSQYSSLHHKHRITSENKISLPEELFNVYLKYLYIDGVGEYEDESEYAPHGCISFMTIHQSKGLEFPIVIVGSLGNVPRRRNEPLMFSVQSRFFKRGIFEPVEDIKYFDFWRLYYVAFSRAQNLLVLANNKDNCRYFATYLKKLPDLSKFDDKRMFNQVKSIVYKHVYSFTSHISVYDGCPEQYKYYKEYAFAQNQMFHTSVGSLVHATLEDVNKCIITGNPEKVTESAICGWFAMNYQRMQEQTGYFLTDEQQNNALMQAIRYYRNRRGELGKVWKAEEEINLVLKDYILQGIIDLIEGKDDAVEIVDYKTGPKPDVHKHPESVEHYKKQLEIYAYLIEKRYGRKVSRMHLYYTSTLEGNPVISFEYSTKSISATIREITDTVHHIENKDFTEGVRNSYACRFCDMKYVCGKNR